MGANIKTHAQLVIVFVATIGASTKRRVLPLVAKARAPAAWVAIALLL